MADLKISELSALAGGNLASGDQLAIADSSASETKRITVVDLVGSATTLIADATIPGAKILFGAGDVSTATLADGSVTDTKLANDSVTAAKIADEVIVDLVTTLPASGAFVGQLALDTTDNTGYIWNGTSWVSFKAAGSVNAVVGDTSGIVNLSVSTVGDQVTITTSLDDTTAAREFLAGPTGSAGSVGYRQIVGSDLPTASTSKGGVAVNGNGLTMFGDTIQIDNTVVAETTEHHVVQYDANGLVTGGRVINAGDVPVATNTTVGTVKPGSGLGVDGTGDLSHSNSVIAGTATKFTFDTEGHVTATESLADADIPDLDAAKITTGQLPTDRIANDAITAAKLADKSTATIAQTTPVTGAFIGQCHLNSLTGDYFLWDGNVWQPIGISVGEIVLAGTYDASVNQVSTVTTEGTAAGLTAGSALPAAATSNKGYYVVVNEAGTGTAPAPTVALDPPDFLLSNGTVWTEIDVSATVVAQIAQNVQFTPAGDIASTNVQSAIEELDSEKAPIADPSFTGAAGFADGTAAAPSITFTNDTNTGFYSSAANELSISTGGGQRVVVDASGDVGIGTDSPESRLSVTTSENWNFPQAFLQRDASNVTTNIKMLAFGLEADTAGLTPAGSSSFIGLNTDSIPTTGSTVSSLNAKLNLTSPGGVIMPVGDVGIGTSSPAGTLNVLGTGAAPSLTYDSDNLVNLDQGSVQLAMGIDPVAPFGTFLQGRDSSNGSRELLLNPAGGNVGIGTTNPASKLEVSRLGSVWTGVAPDGSSAAFLHNGNNSTSSSAGLQISGGSAASSVIYFGDEFDADAGQILYGHGSDSMAFRVNADERMRIDSAGNVGIGTSNPGQKLEVYNAGFVAAQIAGDGTSETQLRFDGNTAARISNEASTDLLFTIGGSEAMRITSAGDVGIGTSSPGSQLELGTSASHLQKRGIAVLNPHSLGLENANYAYTDVNYSGNSAYLTAGFKSDAPNAKTGAFIASTGAGVDGLGGTVNAAIYHDGQGYFAGNVGIGTSTPAAKLEVSRLGAAWTGAAPASVVASFVHNGNNLAGSGAGLQISGGSTASSVIYFGDENDADAGQITYGHNSDSMAFRVNADERMRIDSAGKVLIGTSSSRGVATTTAADFQSETGSISASFVRNTNDSVGAVVSLGKSRGANPGGTTIVQNGDRLGELRFAGADGADLASVGASIRAKVDGTPGADDLPSRLEFLTTGDGASLPAERMRIKSDGVINYVNCPTYADDTAAGSGGLAAGDIYKTSTGELRIKL
jgi:hypothetical protein